MKRTNRMEVRRTAVVALTAIALAALPETVFAGSDALIGTWKLNPDVSRFSPGPTPYRSLTLTFSETERGLRNDAQGVDADGTPFKGGYMIVTDGKDYPVTGMSDFDSSSYTPVSDTTTVYIRKKLGTTVIAGSRVVSSDGKTLVYREKTVDEQGRETGTATLIFDKQ